MAIFDEMNDLFEIAPPHTRRTWRDPSRDRIKEVVTYDDEGEECSYTVTGCYAVVGNQVFMELTTKDESGNQNDPPEWVNVSQCESMDEAEEWVRDYIQNETHDYRLVVDVDNPLR